MNGRKEDIERSDFFQIHTYIQYFKENNKVLLGGLLYPISISEPNRTKFHTTLFEQKDNDTKFIIDGICMNIDTNREEIEGNTRSFIERVKNLLT